MAAAVWNTPRALPGVRELLPSLQLALGGIQEDWERWWERTSYLWTNVEKSRYRGHSSWEQSHTERHRIQRQQAGGLGLNECGGACSFYACVSMQTRAEIGSCEWILQAATCHCFCSLQQKTWHTVVTWPDGSFGTLLHSDSDKEKILRGRKETGRLQRRPV